jgi:hypothetical protein
MSDCGDRETDRGFERISSRCGSVTRRLRNMLSVEGRNGVVFGTCERPTRRSRGCADTTDGGCGGSSVVNVRNGRPRRISSRLCGKTDVGDDETDRVCAIRNARPRISERPIDQTRVVNRRTDCRRSLQAAAAARTIASVGVPRFDATTPREAAARLGAAAPPSM